jgi:hypothetical protein
VIKASIGAARVAPFPFAAEYHAPAGLQYHLSTMAETLRFERVFPLPSRVGTTELKVQQGGAGRFYLIISLPNIPESNEITLSIPSELADSLTHAIGKAADFSGE